jgi:hypothetical protein
VQQLERTIEADRSVSREPTVSGVELLLMLGEALTEGLQRHRARPVFLRAATLALEVNRPDLAARAAAGYAFMTKQGIVEPDAVSSWHRVLSQSTGNIAERAVVEAALATAARLAGDVDLMRKSSEASLASATRAADQWAKRVAVANMSLSLWRSPGLAARIRMAQELEHLAQSEDDIDLELDALGLLVLPLAASGRVAELDDVIARVERLGIEHQRRISVAQSRQWRAMRSLVRGSVDQARTRRCGT